MRFGASETGQAPSLPESCSRYTAVVRPNLSQDCSRFGGGVGGFRDWAAYHDVRGSGGNCFRGSDDARLIIGPTARQADSGRYDGEIAAKLLAQSGRFQRRSDHTLASVRKRQGGQPQDLIERSSAQANHTEFDVVQAGHHRNRADQQAGLDSLGRFDGSSQHLAASGSVHRQHTDAQLSRLADGRAYGIRDVVILEVEKDAASGTHQFADNRRTLGSVELHSDLVRMGGVADGRHDLPGGRARGYVKV